MSTRALRKLQRLKEQETQAHVDEQEEDAAEDEEGDDIFAKPSKPSAFAFLATEHAEGDEDKTADESETGTKSQEDGPPMSQARPSTKTKKKRKKKAVKNEVQDRDLTAPKTDDTDDVDLALLSLARKEEFTQTGEAAVAGKDSIDGSRQQLCDALSIDTYHLHAVNEMRKLFGKVAVSNAREETADGLDGEGVGRRERRRAQQGGLGPGRRGQAGRGLATLGLRKNLFIQGKEDWPKGASNGLGMELVSKDDLGITHYRFVHNGAYQDAQRQFAIAVESMDPQRLLAHLAHNPYHISTLLQVSEIARHERDHTTSGVLLERALFSLGRALHSTFSSTVAAGKARLDFLRPENREFWLAGWRYIRILGMRGTWRTAYEWTRLLLSLSPGQDPYFLAASLDQIALKCRQPQSLLDLADLPHFSDRWGNLPNVSYSRALALHQLRRPDDARTALSEAMAWFPWVVPRLFKELTIARVPPALWGTEPPNEMQALLTEYYGTQAKDLWNTPEAIALLTDVAESIAKTEPLQLKADTRISLDLARHVLLTEDSNLLALLPRKFTTNAGSSSDPLPPPESIGPDIFSLSESGNFMAANAEAAQNFFTRLLAQRRAQGPADHGAEEHPQGRAEFEHELERAMVEGQDAVPGSALPSEGVLRRMMGMFGNLRGSLGLGPTVETESESETDSGSESEDVDFEEEAAQGHRGAAGQGR